MNVGPAGATSSHPALTAHLTGFGGAALFGALAALGRPGIDLAPAYFLGVGVLCFVAIRSSLPTAMVFALGWGIALFPTVTLGTVTWGRIVPIALTFVGCGLCSLPLALWSWWAARRWKGWSLFASTAAAWALWMEVGDFLGYPLNGATLSLVTCAAPLLGGVRLVGANVLDGVMTAGLLVTAQRIARAPPEQARGRARRLLAVPLTTVAILAVLAAASHAAAPPPAGQVRVGVPQLYANNLYYESRMTAPQLAEAFAKRVDGLLAKLRDVELLVLTESFDGRFGLLIPAVRDAWQKYAAAHHQAILFTSFMVEENGWKSNAVGGFAPSGQWVAIHRKVDLAPYGERHLAAGIGYQPLPVLPSFTVGSLLCEESLLARPARRLAIAGAALLAASTSDTTFGSSIVVFEHLAMGQLRALEAGRSIVWASNGGPSALIDRWGNLKGLAPFREAAAVRFDALLFSDVTPFIRLRWLWLVVCGGVLVLSLFASQLSEPSPQSRSRPALDAASPPQRRNPLVGAVLQILLAAFSLCLGLTSPALVEMARGESARGATALGELFAPRTFISLPDPFARFRSGAARSSLGALGYYLSYYGEEPGEALRRATEPASLSELQAIASEHLPSRLIALREESLPRVATLVQNVDGAFGVMTRPTGEGDAQVFSPLTGLTSRTSVAQLLSQVKPFGIIPSVVRCEPAVGCHAVD